jgi:coenzyme PQQ synthesis protein D (PqqD)
MTSRHRGASTLSLETVVARRPGLLDAKVDNEIVALNIESGICYGLNPVGARVWNLIEEPTRIREICDTLLMEYTVEPDTCRREVLELIEELMSEGLIVVSDKAS